VATHSCHKPSLLSIAADIDLILSDYSIILTGPPNCTHDSKSTLHKAIIDIPKEKGRNYSPLKKGQRMITS
jgi:hypothetical protein